MEPQEFLNEMDGALAGLVRAAEGAQRRADAGLVRAEIGKWSNLSPVGVDAVLERIAAAIESRREE